MTAMGNPLFWKITHQAFFGGIAAAGFGVLFNCPPRILGLCFGSGALALAVRTFAQGHGMSLPAASFIAALALAIVDSTWQRAQSPRGSVIAVVGCIAMVPGSLAAKALMGFIAIVSMKQGIDDTLLSTTLVNLLMTTFTLIAIGVGLCVPVLLHPQKRES